jgi:hypothetical protein
MSTATASSELDLSGVLDLAPPPPPPQPAPKRTTTPRASTATAKARGKQFLYFDLETVPDESRLDLFGLGELPSPLPPTPIEACPAADKLIAGKVDEIKKSLAGLNPPAEWIDAAEAAEKALEKPRKGVLDELQGLRDRQNGEDGVIQAAIEDRRKLLSVTPEFNRIVAVGWAIGTDTTEAMVVGEPLAMSDTTKTSEIDLIDKLWSLIAGNTVVGFNVLHFDLPTLFVRSALLGVKPPRKLDLRPWGDDVVDLMAVRYPKGPGRKLKELAAYYGFAVPAGDFDGSKVYETWKAGEFNQLAAYVRSDVEISRKIHNFYRGFFTA